MLMGRRSQGQGQLFYQFRLDEAVPDDHLVRKIRAMLDLSWIYAELAPHYSEIGRQAARYPAHAVTCLSNVEAAPDETTRRAHLAITRHFYLLAEGEIGQHEVKRRLMQDNQHPRTMRGPND